MKKVLLVVALLAGLFNYTCTLAEGLVEAPDSGISRAAGQTSVLRGSVSNVIVYHGQALVTRTIELPAGGDNIEVVIDDLPERVLPETIFAGGPPELTILSVRYREKSLGQDNRREIEALQDQIHQVQRKILNADRNRQNIVERTDLFRQQWKLNIEATNINLSKGILDAEPFQKITGYLEQKSIELHRELVIVENEKLDLQEQLNKLEEQKAKLVSQQAKTRREAVVFANRPAQAVSQMQLSYLVSGADWSPQYNLRAQPDDSTALIEYNAVIHQSSGEDWTNTALALSTAEPSIVASPPVLEPMEITLGPKGTDRVYLDSKSHSTSAGEAEVPYEDQGQAFGVMLENRKRAIGRGSTANTELNTYAQASQMMEFQADKQTLVTMQTKAKELLEGISVMYRLNGKLTLPSRSDQQLLTIARITAQAEYVLTASPLLTDYVYLQGRLLNSSDTIMLPGPATMYRNGEFVGKGRMPLVTIGQKFTTGFGIDSQIQVKRLLRDKKTDTTWGGNRIDLNDYIITINNYKNTPVRLRLLDRLAISKNKDIEIRLTEVSPKISEDPEYIRTEKDNGILRWDLTLAPSSVDEKATVVAYKFTMKYDNQKEIQNVKK